MNVRRVKRVQLLVAISHCLIQFRSIVRGVVVANTGINGVR